MNELYIFVNSDLKMGKGKICSQVVHGINKLHKNIHTRSLYVQEDFDRYMNDSNCNKVVVTLKATEEQIKEQIKEISLNHNCEMFLDGGRTQVPENSLTILALYPTRKTKDFSMFKLV